ncbi:MAG: polyamine ABC transporter ATP-binding protein, partial [Thalassolituus sp.]
VTVAVRPEKLKLTEKGTNPANEITGTIQEIAYLGDVSIYHIDLPGGKRVQFTQSNIQALAELPLTWGQEITLTWSSHSCGVLSQ